MPMQSSLVKPKRPGIRLYRIFVKVNNHPQSGWLDSPPVRGADQGHVSAMGALFRKPSPKAMVSQKTMN